MTTSDRADHLGSFLRSAELLAARNDPNGTPEAVRAIEDAEILRVLANQQELGFGIYTDGELRRRNFMSDFTDAVDGFDYGDAVARAWQGAGTDLKVTVRFPSAGVKTILARFLTRP